MIVINFKLKQTWENVNILIYSSLLNGNGVHWMFFNCELRIFVPQWFFKKWGWRVAGRNQNNTRVKLTDVFAEDTNKCRLKDKINSLHGTEPFLRNRQLRNCSTFTNILWNPKVHYRVNESPPLIPILSHINPVHTSPLCRSQWLRGLRHEPSSLDRTLGSWVRIPLKASMSVYLYSVFVLFCV
jgi:hypothetical protein